MSCGDLPLRNNQRITSTSSTDITGAASTIASVDLTANRALISNSDGKVAVSAVTSTELGYLSGATSNIQSQINGLQATITTGDLTESTSSILTFTGNTDAIIGAGLTIEVTPAASGQDGYLKGSDWAVFNGKLATTLTDSYIFVGSAGNVATGVAVSGDITMANDGTTAIAAGVIVDADVNASAGITLSKLAATTASRALVSDASGFIVPATTTSTEIGYVNGVTSAIQTQIDTKLTVSLSGTATGDIIYYDGANHINLGIGSTGEVLKVAGGIPSWAAEATPAGVPTGGTTAQYLEKIDATDYNTQWVTLTASKITDLTATASEINILSGVTASSTEINYLVGVSSAIQTQINGKQDDITGAATSITTANLTASRALISDPSGKVSVSSTTSTELGYVNGVTDNIQTQLNAKQTATLTNNAILIGSGGVATELAAGTEGYVLTISSGTPAWVAASGGASSGANNEVQTSDGAGGFVASNLFFDETTGHMTLGDTSLSGSSRDITMEGSAASVGMNYKPKGSGSHSFYLDSAAKRLVMLWSSTDSRLDFRPPIDSQILRISGSVGSAGAGADLEVMGGNASTSAAGHLILRGGKSTSSTDGSTKIVSPTSLTTRIEVDNTGVGFFAATPIAQPSSTGETTGFTAGTGTGVNDDSTFTGNVGSTAYRVSDIVKHLKNLGLIAS